LTPLLRAATAAEGARGQAHAAYLRLAAANQRRFADVLAFQTTLLESLVTRTPLTPPLRGRGGEDGGPPRSLDRRQCLEFAVGSVARVLGPAYADLDALATRVRLPDEPLMLVDRILHIDGEPLSLGPGRVVTEHDVRPDVWYLDGGRAPTCIAVEAGQADLFLSGFLGIDRHTRGQAVYRLLDAVVTFHRGLPEVGRVLRYDIHIDSFFRQGQTHLFRFRFEGTADGEPLLSMTDGCAGFFTAAELAAGKGIVRTSLDLRPGKGVVPDDADELAPLAAGSYTAAQVDALRAGNLAGCFGPAFAGLRLGAGLRLPGGRMRLVDRVTHLDPHGGLFAAGVIRAEADIAADAWFLTCHFRDDPVMPGTLMYECCLHTLRLLLLRLGWVSEDDAVVCEPVPGVASRLRCRGQVIPTTRTVTYEVTVKERGYRPEPYVIGDALMYADGKAIVECGNLSLRLRGLTRERLRETWARFSSPLPRFGGEGSGVRGPTAQATTVAPSPPLRGRGEKDQKAPLYGPERILAFAVGRPSEAFGEPYRVFDAERVIARLPGPPYLFLDRVTEVQGEPWQMAAGAAAVCEYDVPPDAWYFTAERQPLMPFAVLLEVALQPCGWLAAFAGSARTSPIDLSFRNLGGQAELLAPVTPLSGTLTTRTTLTGVSASAGMILQTFAFEVSDAVQAVYRGQTSFGFFSKEALRQQVGLRDVQFHQPAAEEMARLQSFAYPRQTPFPDDRLRMIDRVEAVADGGRHGLGWLRGVKAINPAEWFFRAHFYQDPVMPGSLGVESFVQLLKAAARRRWPDAEQPAAVLGPHRWLYRGQVLPTSGTVVVEAVVTGADEGERSLTASGLLAVDGRPIYRLDGFTLALWDGRKP
jgi:3-hydroxymyristoyl/3-hydroxydecanoyl-(acyl carrier protein) dehydratase